MTTLPPLDAFVSVATLDALPQPAFAYRFDGMLMAYNREAEKLYGISREHVVGKFNAFETEILDKAIVDGIREALTGHTNTVLSAQVDTTKSEQLASISRKVVTVENTNIPLHNAATGDVVYVLILQRDVTDLIEQRRTIVALGSPIIDVWDGILLLPVIGTVTEERATGMMDKVLAAVRDEGARYMILDLTGSDQLDTRTANYFSRILRAVELLGARGIIVGIRPHLAQTMTSLGLELREIRTYRNLREALSHCMRELLG